MFNTNSIRGNINNNNNNNSTTTNMMTHDENAFVVPSVSHITTKMMLNTNNPTFKSKPFSTTTTSNTSTTTTTTTTTRTCLGDISNHHLNNNNNQKQVTNSLPFKSKPLTTTGSTNNLNNSKENIKQQQQQYHHHIPNTTSTTTTTSFVPICIPPSTTINNSTSHSISQQHLITPSVLSSLVSTSSQIPSHHSITANTHNTIVAHKEESSCCSSPPPKSSTNSRILSMINSPKIDDKDTYDPQYCTQYIKDIINHYRSIEKKYMPDPNYMSRQTDLQPQMRAILIDWLIDVHCKFLLVPETLYLTLNIVDRFLSEKVISRQRLQLVGITAMFIASKYEEISSPIIADFVKITKDAYSRDEVLKMERIMLQVLDFNLTVATSNVFLKRYLKCGRCTELQTFIAIYLSELSLMDYAQLEFTPSTIACSAVYLSKHLTQDLEQWDLVLQHYTDKSEEDILPCARVMLKYLKKISSQRRDAHNKPFVAAVNKYKKEDKLSASRVCAKMVDLVQLK